MSESRSPARAASHEAADARSDRPIMEATVFVPESDFDVIGIEDLVSIWHDAGLEAIEPLTCHESGAVVQVAVERPLDGDRLGSLECVDWWEAVSKVDDRRRYVVEFTAPNFPPSVIRRSDELFDACEFGLDDHGITVSFVGPQQPIADLIDEYESAGLSPRLRKFGSFEGHHRPLDTLIGRQRDVVMTAYEMGYFEVPREVTSEEIASELAIDASTVTEHLQRAKRNLLAQDLSAERR